MSLTISQEEGDGNFHLELYLQCSQKGSRGGKIRKLRAILSIWNLWERFGGFGERPGGFGEYQESYGEKYFFAKIWKIFIFEVFASNMEILDRAYDESSCHYAHVESWNRP